MSKEFLEDRRQSLEEQFFHKDNQAKLAGLKEKLVGDKSKHALRKASGMEDDVVLDKLIELGIAAETVAALSLVPLIRVAWADGKIQKQERESILHGAEGKGIEKDSPAFDLLDQWLTQTPPDSLFEAWKAYIMALRRELTAEQANILKNQVTRFARVVAESAGGFLGLGKVSDSEETAIADIGAAFTDALGGDERKDASKAAVAVAVANDDDDVDDVGGDDASADDAPDDATDDN